MTGSVSDLSEGKKKISDAVIGGAALKKFQDMIEKQGVAKETARRLCSAETDYFSIMRKSKHQEELKTPAEGETFDYYFFIFLVDLLTFSLIFLFFFLKWV